MKLSNNNAICPLKAKRMLFARTEKTVHNSNKMYVDKPLKTKKSMKNQQNYLQKTP